MKKKLFTLIYLLLLLIVFPTSCKNDYIEYGLDNKDEKDKSYLEVAKNWYYTNSKIRSKSSTALDLSPLTAIWNKYKMTVNAQGDSVITIPLLSKTDRIYREIGLVKDKKGKSYGVIKEYLSNPFIENSFLNIYSGRGRLLETALYNYQKKTFQYIKSNNKANLLANIKNKIACVGCSGSISTGFEIEEVVVTGYKSPDYNNWDWSFLDEEEPEIPGYPGDDWEDNWEDHGGGSESSGGDSNSGTGASSEEQLEDFDLSSNCASWEYSSVGTGNYQVAAVTELDFDFASMYMGADGKYHIEYYRGEFNKTLYFEFPKIRENGQIISPQTAAMLTAYAKDNAEKILESHVEYSPVPKNTIQSNAMIERYYQILQSQMKQFGGRVSKINHYNTIGSKKYSKSLFPCYQ